MKPNAPPTLSSLVTLPKPAAPKPPRVRRSGPAARSMGPSSSPISRLGKWAHPPKGTR
jgi:hypothetical protein